MNIICNTLSFVVQRHSEMRFREALWQSRYWRIGLINTIGNFGFRERRERQRRPECRKNLPYEVCGRENGRWLWSATRQSQPWLTERARKRTIARPLFFFLAFFNIITAIFTIFIVFFFGVFLVPTKCGVNKLFCIVG